MSAKFFVRALTVVGTALGAGLIALGRHGDKVGAGTAVDARHYVVQFRSRPDQSFRVYCELPDYPQGARKTLVDATAIARSLTGGDCEAHVVDLHTGRTVTI